MTRRELLNMLALTAATEALPKDLAFAGGYPPVSQQNNLRARDWRDITNGWDIPRENYSDQPYVVITRDGNWLCVLTTGKGGESDLGQHIVSTISSDQGRTWSPPIDIEPPNGPEASWVMPLVVPSGRVYVFYTYNFDNLRFDPKCNDPGNYAKRITMMGRYAVKYSDDYGRSWSTKRYYIPMREMRIDRENAWNGSRLYFWGVGKPISTRTGMMFGFAKVGKYGLPGGTVTSQGCIMHSPNILTETDPEKIQWQIFPDGDEGLQAPKGPVAEELNLAELSDGSLYATYRTIDGHNCHSYSRDGGHTWTPPAYATYTPDGRKIKHPRAANFVRKLKNGKYILWFHNHGGERVLTAPWKYYTGRNPAWIAGGVEHNGFIHWSQPEILLYDQDPQARTSYPDFIEENGEVYVTETIKTNARVHHIDGSLLEDLWSQSDRRNITTKGLVLAVTEDQLHRHSTIKTPQLPSLSAGGFTIEFWIRFRELSQGQSILNVRNSTGKGFSITTSERETLVLSLNDGKQESSWDSDPGFHPGTMRVGTWQHVAFVVDGGPKVITVMVDGVLNDGGPVREYGWTHFNPDMEDVNGLAEARIGDGLFGDIKLLRIYDRYLRTSELMGNWRAGI